MKFKGIQKFQTGGGFASFTPVIRPMPTAPVAQNPQDDSKNASVLDDDLYKDLIKSGGLVNDVNFFASQLAEIESDPFAYANPNSRAKTLQLMAKINEIKQNKSFWDQAVKEASSNGALDEAAIGSQGELFVQGEDGNIGKISMKTYSEKPEQYKVLSVSELLNARQYNPNLVFDRSIFAVAEQSVGLTKITDHIKSAIGLIAEAGVTSEKTYSKEQIGKRLKAAFGKTPTEAERQGLQTLLELAESPGDYVKVYNESSGKRHNIDKALNYIWTTLSMPAQKKLQIAAIQNGKSNAKEIVWDILLASTEPTLVNKITPLSDQDVNGSGSSKNEKNLTVFQMFHKDKLADPRNSFSFNDPELKALFTGAVGSKGPLVDQKDNQIGSVTLGDILRGYGLGRIVESDKVFFGNQHVGLENLNNVIYDGENAGKVYMPVGPNGSPDYESLEEFKKIYAEYEENKDNWSATQAESFFKKHGYRLQIDEVNGEKFIRDNNVVKPFLVMYGYTNDATGLEEDNDNWVKKLSKKEQKEIVPYLERIWTIGTGKNIQNLTPDKSWHKEKYYKGIIAIPYRKEATAIVDAIVGQGALETINPIGTIQNNIRNSSNTGLNANNSANILKNIKWK